MTRYRRKRDPFERFWEKVTRTDDDTCCWLWNANRRGRGYGSFVYEGRTWQAHRWIYMMLNGPVGDTMDVCHRCDVPSCVRPSHLFAGSRSDNMRDCARKGRNIMQLHPERSALSSGMGSPRARGEAHGNAKLTAQVVTEIRIKRAMGISALEIAALYGICESHVRRLVRGTSWSHLPKNEGSRAA